MAIKIKWDITYKCNLNCKHCVNGLFLGKTENELSKEEVFSVIDKLDGVSIDFIHLLGGEPTARKDFVDIMQYLDKKGIFFGFNTNGLKLNDDKILDEIVRNKHVKNIIFSIEGPTAEVNDRIRGKNVFNITINNLKRLIQIKEKYNFNNLTITINTVLSKLNMDYISEMIDFCIELRVDQFVLLQLIPEGNAKDTNASLSFEEEVKTVEVIAKKYSEIKDKLDIVPRFTRPIAMNYCKSVLGLEFPKVTHGCGAGVNFSYMNNKGELYPCDRYVEQIKEKNDVSNLSLVNNDFYDIWSLPGYDDLYKITEGIEFYKNLYPCINCEYLQSECYPCPVRLEEKNDIIIMRNCEQYVDLIKKNTII